MSCLSLCLRRPTARPCTHYFFLYKSSPDTAFLLSTTWICRRGVTTQHSLPLRQRLNIRKLISRLQLRGPDCVLQHNERTWLEQKGYNEAEVSKWRQVSIAETAEDALASINSNTPVYLLLQTFQKSTSSRYTFYKLVCLFRSSSTKFDDVSWFTGYRILLKLAFAIDPSLLKLLGESIPMMPRSFSSYTFNRILKMLSLERSRHPETSTTQTAIVREMAVRDLELNREGYEALLHEAAHMHKQYEQIRRQMSAAGYDPSGSAHRLHEKLFHKQYRARKSNAHLMSRLENAESLEQCLHYVKQFQGNPSDPRLWSFLLTKDEYRTQTLQFCVELIERHEIALTTVLTGRLIQSCKSPRDRHFVSRICRGAAQQGLKFDTFVWTEYLKRLIWSGKLAEVLTIVTNEPGGNDILDMDPAIRRDPRIWTSIIHQINCQVKRGLCNSTKHAVLLGEIRISLDRFGIVLTQPLLWCLLEAALLSGPRQWAGKHSCDTVVSHFKASIDLENEPWKIRADKRLWTAYMRVLVANEETGLLSEAMEHFLSEGTLPDSQQLKLFALGIWEAGSIEAIQHWQTYFEGQPNLESAWPSSEETFKYRSILAKHELRWFYD